MRALVTGASSGIGRALAVSLAKRGHEVVLAARRESLLVDLADELRRAGGRATVLPLDVADTDATVASLRRLDDEAPLDMVIANAGVGVPPEVTDPTSWEAIEAAFHTNFCGAAATLTAVLPAMVRRAHGHLVGISSLASFGALPASAAYCAPKAGLSMLLDCLRLDLLDTGVAVTTVHLGFVRTPMVERSTHPMPQLLEADDAAERIVTALASRPAILELPQPLAAATRALAKLPRFVREGVSRGIGRKIR